MFAVLVAVAVLMMILVICVGSNGVGGGCSVDDDYCNLCR